MKKQLLIITLSLILLFVNLSGCQENTETEDGTQDSQNDDNSEVSNGDDIFQSVCQTAINDYPEWTLSDTEIIICEKTDKSVFYRNSPEDLSVGIDSPVSISETLVDMDFIGLNEISYVKTKDDKWYICLFKLNGMEAPDNSVIYEKSESISYIDVSPVNINEFIVFYITDNNAVLEYLNVVDSTEENLLETSVSDSKNQKLAVSVKGSYVYLLYDGTLRIFDIASKTKFDEIDAVESVVWIEDSYLLYSNSEATYIYKVENKGTSKLSKVSSVSNLCFNPKNNGMLAFTEQGSAKVINCGTWQISGPTEDAQILSLASEQTAIIEKEGFVSFWRFYNADWTVMISEGFSNYATVWKRY